MPGPPQGPPNRREGRPRHLADARERFLTSQDFEPDIVRETILASWWRSRQLNVEADHVDAAYVQDLDPHSPLLTCATPILRQLGEQLQSQPISIILTDAQGVVLDRVDSDDAITSYLDRVNLAPGFSYAEQFVGTNGIGTALAERVATLVDGHEHYADNLERLVCAGVPIKHPVKGTLLGALDLTSWSGESNSLMLALASSTAERIEKSLLTQSGLRELALFQEYLKTCQRSDGIVLAINSDLVMMNETARRILSASDQHSLLETAGDVLGATKAATVISNLPSGLVARMRYRPVLSQRGPCGGVFDIQLTETPVPRSRTAEPAPVRDGVRLPGLVGTSSSWQRCLREVEACCTGGEWLVLTGEPGTGKQSLLRALHQRINPSGHFRCFDAADTDEPGADVEEWLDALAAELSQGQGSLVLAHADRLTAEALVGVGELLQQYGDHGGSGNASWVAITMSAGLTTTEHAAQLLPHFPHTVEVPSLRHHSEDIAELVPVLLESITAGRRLKFSFDAMQQLSRLPWPGNVAQLRQVLSEVVRHRRSGTVTAADLPPEARSAIRRRLSQLESLERDAIVRSLTANDGNKELACAELGLSRATIYRKIRDFGITVPKSAPGPS